MQLTIQTGIKLHIARSSHARIPSEQANSNSLVNTLVHLEVKARPPIPPALSPGLLPKSPKRRVQYSTSSAIYIPVPPT